MKRLIPYLTTLFLLSACSSPPSQFYALTPLTHHSEIRYVNKNIAIGPVNIAEYLQQPAIVTRLHSHQLSLHEFKRWAEPLQSNISTILVSNLQGLLPRSRIMSYNTVEAENARIRVSVQIIEFATDMTGHSDLNASWKIIDEKENKIIHEYHRNLSTGVNVYDFNSIVAGMNHNLNQLTHLIAKTL